MEVMEYCLGVSTDEGMLGGINKANYVSGSYGVQEWLRYKS
jgi:hypothetical protein